MAFDTAAEVFSVALQSKTGISYIEIDSGSRHSELLVHTADKLCEIAEIRPSDISMVACAKGPGSFTGLRIGFSAAKGIASALKIPLCAIPTLDYLAYPLSDWDGLVLPALDAKKGRFFAALYRRGTRISDYADISPEALAQEIDRVQSSPQERIMLTGCGAHLLENRLALCLSEFQTANMHPNRLMINPYSRRGGAVELLKIAKNGIIPCDAVNSGPIYLRKSDAELNLRGR
jgi:tRNA threonylcarbamoyladenosine biosynthesis protein TsaB